MKATTPGQEIHDEVMCWKGVEVHQHRFGGTEYRLGQREIGHVQGDYLVDIPFPRKVRDELVAGGRAEPHHVLPESGWISFYIRQPSDVARAMELLRLSFERASRRRPAAQLIHSQLPRTVELQ